MTRTRHVLCDDWVQLSTQFVRATNGCTKKMNNTKEDAVFVQTIERSPLDASKSIASDRCLAAVASALAIAVELAGNIAG